MKLDLKANEHMEDIGAKAQVTCKKRNVEGFVSVHASMKHPQMGIIRSQLTQKYGNLPLPSYWGNLYGNFSRFYYQKVPNVSQFITLNTQFG